MEKINLVELLKDCPQGMELDCAIYNEVKLISVDEREDISFPIKVCREDGFNEVLTKYGQYTNADFAKCIIFPKGKTTWEGFQRPFKDGDVVYIRTTFKWVAIYKELEKGRNEIGKYASIRLHSRFNNTYLFDDRPLCHNKDVNEIRFASEKEKQILFDAIKENGYQWNAETKTLQKVITLKFKIGDKIRAKGTNSYTKILGIKWDQTETCYETLLCEIPVKDQDKFELVPVVPKFKVGDRVKKNKDYISGIITDISDGTYKVEYKSGGVAYANIGFQDDWELVPNKFDINTLKPFDRVLVRDRNKDKWTITFFSHCNNLETYKYSCTHYTGYAQCIPYEGNEHLLNTTNDCDEYYKTWAK